MEYTSRLLQRLMLLYEHRRCSVDVEEESMMSKEEHAITRFDVLGVTTHGRTPWSVPYRTESPLDVRCWMCGDALNWDEFPLSVHRLDAHILGLSEVAHESISISPLQTREPVTDETTHEACAHTEQPITKFERPIEYVTVQRANSNVIRIVRTQKSGVDQARRGRRGADGRRIATDR
jgi:hypothetical protein